MTVVAVNLIPRALRDRRAASARALRWAAGCGVLSCVVAAAWLVIASRVVEDREALAGQLTSARSAADEKSRLLSEAQTAHAAALRRLESARAVAGHPDWSVLLALLARARGEGMVLERVDVRPIPGLETLPPPSADNPASNPALRPAVGYQLELRGVGESQSAVTHYLLALERIGLFESVRLRETKPRTVGARGVVEFGLDCAIVSGKAPKPPGAPGAEHAAASGGKE